MNTLRPIIIGFGPAGIFAALELIAHGKQPILFERGQSIEIRHADVARFIKERTLSPESNIQFGEGGAGTYSDGKLFSRINNSPIAARILDTLITFGAPPEIRCMPKPHLGTDRLVAIVKNMRDYILAHGGDIYFGAKLTSITIANKKAVEITINGNQNYAFSSLFLAIGNSSWDTCELLHQSGIALEAKPVRVGVRIEHPVEVINRMRYRDAYLEKVAHGAATYSFTHTNRLAGRGAYTFCMCPGGEVVNASSHERHLVLNGMSYSGRSSNFSNAGIVVTCRPEDFGDAHPLAGISFVKAIEQKAFIAGGAGWKAPAQNLTDFLHERESISLLENSFKMATKSAMLDELFPAFITSTLRHAFDAWKKEEPLFVDDTALLIAPETRTSSPVRILRNERYESVTTQNLFPIGEGSGYTGGIVSAAIDAIKAVRAVMA